MFLNFESEHNSMPGGYGRRDINVLSTPIRRRGRYGGYHETEEGWGLDAVAGCVPTVRQTHSAGGRDQLWIRGFR
jgi:hypothetical protein